jgi:hypothetical protein
MATSAPRLKPKGPSDGHADRVTAPAPSEREWPFFSFVQDHRNLFLATPIWFGAIMIALHTYGSPELRAAIDFLNGAPPK